MSPSRRRLRSVGAAGANGAGDKSPKPRLRKLRAFFVLAGLAVLAFISWIFGIMMAVGADLPRLEDRAQFQAAKNSVIYDQYGTKLATVTNNSGRILVNSSNIAQVMKEATVAIEDKRFYEHRGVDWIGIARAVKADLISGGSAQGASTITQQFVKNALSEQGSRTVFEKLREAALAYHLEREWPKDKILTEYLNEIYFGEGAYGIESAASTYFGWNHPGCAIQHKCAAELLPWEAATIAGIISSPTGYDPKTNPVDSKARRNLVLQNMADQGYISPEELTQYEDQPLPKPSQIHPPVQQSRAPYFTTWLRQQLVDLYGAGEAFSGGLHITSTLDLPLEDSVQQIVDSRLAGLGPSSAVVVLDNATGGVRAMVGGLDYKTEPFNVATEGARQPGSSFKPFTLVTALRQGVSPDTVFASAPQNLPYRAEVKGKNGKEKIVPDVFRVSNYGDEYLGSASVTTATTYSDNSVYSQLGMQVGPQNIAQTAHDMGITSDLSTPGAKYSINNGPFYPYNPALILGGLQTGVNPLEMAHAYETIAQNGQLTSGTMAPTSGAPIGIEQVKHDHKLVPPTGGGSGKNEVKTSQVIDPAVAETAHSILETVVQNGTGVRANTGDPGEFGKTGTTENNGDAWFVGATKQITVAIWVGYPDSVKPMTTEYNGGPVDGGTIPAELFNTIVNSYEQLQADRAAKRPTPSSSTTTPAPSTGITVAPTTTTATPAAPTAPATPAAPATGGGGDAGATQQAPAQSAPPASGSGGAAPSGGVGTG
jgi:penicillin-binding protein 1A